VGSVDLLSEAATQMGQYVELTGPVPRSEIPVHFRWADVFLLPSICEGSATATYEALAHGLPIVCTPNTGSVVKDGVEGFVIPIRNVAGLVARLQQFNDDLEILKRMAASASRRASEFTLPAYGRRLLDALNETHCL
jgi:glycosyltransferase involved in cell wall biosynthesis